MKKKKYSSVSEFAKENEKIYLQKENSDFLEYLRLMLVASILVSENSFLTKLQNGYKFHFNTSDKYFTFELLDTEKDLAYWTSCIRIDENHTYSVHCYTKKDYICDTTKEMEKLVVDVIKYWESEYGEKEISSNGQ